MTLLVAGSAAMFDLILSVDRIPGSSEVGVLQSDAGGWMPGGSAFTIALAMRRQGLGVAVWHPLSDEPEALATAARLRQEGIDLSRCPLVAAPAARCVMVHAPAERLAWSSAAPAAPDVDLDAMLHGIEHLVVVARWGVWTDRMLQAAAARRIPASLIGEVSPEAALHRWHCVVLDERQAAAVGTLQAATIVTTHGSRGAVIHEAGRETVVPAAPARLADPTGAGDVFGGTFLARRLQGASAAEAGGVAAGMAALTCGAHGAWAAFEVARTPAAAAASRTDRVRGALAGTACGDAFGMPNSFIADPPWLTVMMPGPVESPYHAGYPAGRITDDTEQALALTQALEDGFDIDSVAQRLDAWFVSVGGAASLAVGPSTRRAMLAYEAGTSPAETGRSGVTNGAAMRIAPIGVYAALRGLQGEALVDVVATACWPTHATGPAIAGAAALAAAIAAGIAGLGWSEMMRHAEAGAELGARRGSWVYAASVAARIAAARRLVAGIASPQEVARLVSDVAGAGEPTTESVPAALAIADWAGGDPRLAIEVAGNLRGDTDTIAAMAGAVCGAFAGETALPSEWRRLVATVNGLEVAAWSARLEAVALRDAARS